MKTHADPIYITGKNKINGIKNRILYATNVLLFGKVEVTFDFMEMYKNFVRSMDADQAHRLRKIIQKIERTARQ